MDILFDKLLQETFAHDMLGIVFVKVGLLEIIAIFACQIAERTDRLEHDV
jgi:hypothetical protein